MTYSLLFPPILDFSEWLEDGDEIWVWAKSNMQYLADLWHRHVGANIPRTYAVAFDIRKMATRRRSDAESPYTILAVMGENPPYPEHRASNDTEALRRLFSRLGVQQNMYAKTPSKMPTVVYELKQAAIFQYFA